MATSDPKATDTIVIGELLERNAKEAPDESFIKFDEGVSWTRQEGLVAAKSAAQAFHECGVGPGDRVAVLLPNGPGFLAAWWGASFLGAVATPINTAFRGSMLERAVAQADGAVLVVDDELGEVLSAVNASAPRILKPSDLEGKDFGSLQFPKVNYWDDMMMIMSSGTTGPSKFSRLSYLFPYVGWADQLTGEKCTNKDVLQVDLPLFHAAAACMTYGALVVRARMRLRRRPVFKSYWQSVKEDGVTGGFVLGTISALLEAADPSPADRDHSMRFMIGTPVPPRPKAFKERFGISRIYAGYGATESGSVTWDVVPDVMEPGFCGRVRKHFEILLVDDNYQEVPVGTVGHALVRSKRPCMMFSGYFRNLEASERAWRHGWYNTGDLMRVNKDGTFFFVDRAGDALRRRGENISALEVEFEVATHPAIAEASCVAVPADSGVEDEVKVWLVLKPGAKLDFEELLTYCAERLPHFMVPRYFEITDEFEKTPSVKVKKYLLRDRGNSEATWDAAKHGLVVTRRGLERVQPQRDQNEK